jgi:AAA family ATP:ADP antiporter
VIKALFQKVVDVRDEEMKALLWATAYGFFILFSYYILRAVRDDISSADRGNLQLLWTAVFFVMLGAVPLYSWVSSRFDRTVFVPLANRFFIACLVAFFVALQTLSPEARPWIDRVFYVWTSVFALFVVTVFWGFVNDCFDNSQGRRLYAFIAVGSSLGGIAGSSVTAGIAELVPTFALLLLACVPLEAASWCVKPMSRWFAGQDLVAVEGGTADGAGGESPVEGEVLEEADRPLAGDAWSGIKVVFQDRYLLGIAAFIALMTFASTILYYEQAYLVGEAFSDRGERTAFYAQIDLAVNVLTILFQVYLTARVIRMVGVGISLALIPALTFLGFAALGTLPLLGVLVAVQVAYRAGRYGITRPAREILFTVVGREQKYKSKAFIDAAVYRGGDLTSGWIFAGLQALGLSLGAIALTAAPVAGLWAVLGYKLGLRQDERAAAEASPAAAEAAAGTAA